MTSFELNILIYLILTILWNLLCFHIPLSVLKELLQMLATIPFLFYLGPLEPLNSLFFLYPPCLDV